MAYKTEKEYEQEFRAGGMFVADARRAAKLECIEDHALEAVALSDAQELSLAILELIRWIKQGEGK